MSHSMRLVLYDIGDPRRRVLIGARPWRTLLQELVTFGVVDAPKANRLLYYLGGRGSSIDAADCRSIAEFVRGCLVTIVPTGGRLILPTACIEFDASPGETVRDILVDQRGTRAAFPRGWLEEFADLCSVCSGLGVIADSVEPRQLTPRVRSKTMNRS